MREATLQIEPDLRERRRVRPRILLDDGPGTVQRLSHSTSGEGRSRPSPMPEKQGIEFRVRSAADSRFAHRNFSKPVRVPEQFRRQSGRFFPVLPVPDIALELSGNTFRRPTDTILLPFYRQRKIVQIF